MSFTNDDLKRLLERLERDEFLVSLPPSVLQALPARLEAAECLIEAYLGPNGAIPPDETDELYTEWLRSSGRTE